MKPIHTRDDVLRIAARNAPTKACERIMGEFGASVFGGVKSPDGLPGWVVRVERTGRHAWLIGVWLDDARRVITITYPDCLPDGAVLIEGNLL